MVKLVYRPVCEVDNYVQATGVEAVHSMNLELSVIVSLT